MQNIHKIKQDICEIGKRIYAKGFAAANDGNITVRVSENEVLCTPTMHCKGYLKPEDISVVDMTGKQLSGNKKRSSEALLHLEIYKQRPELKSVVHCHPPHATAFAVAREPIPQCVLPEVEVFLGDVPITKYETPGGQAFADTVIPYIHKSNVIILANHGTVSFGENVERAYWWTEILDAYCRILLLSRQLGHVQYLSGDKSRELLELKDKWGFTDPRLTKEFENCDICANDVFRDSWEANGVSRRAFDAPPAAGSMSGGAAPAAAAGKNVDEEQLVKLITAEVMRQMGKA
ncbi:Methylthioribulose-1-phosphate dehydratase [Rosistilla carotiformis]|uniref:Methylthioribulose-1-phosphate dehydratase n=1 Tax=Rosistilla carotiformis TaxID=2528017 RepID=A0A518JWX5_9BACT|nr:class II aldolase/adducin family protein [Rosistilla carotiformis]QDV70040.1 Methylthioribulose-1-phosphate dehydratase [Rosistilla carotiformis]